MKCAGIILIFFLGILCNGFGQGLHAVQGSSYAGSLGVGNNPASIVNTPFSWDVALFSVQAKYATNAVTIHNYSLISSPANSLYEVRGGDYRRRADFNYNINLLNARVALNKKKAIALGVNMRGYGQANIGPYNFIDTLETFREFAAMNDNKLMQARFKSSNWLEIFATYSQTLFDLPEARLNAGITIRLMRGIGGGYVNASNLLIRREEQTDEEIYKVTRASAAYGYSSNFDEWKSEKSGSQNIRDFISHTQGGIALDLGAEYLIKSGAIGSVFDDDDYHGYEWKIGVSLLDLGLNRYKHGKESRTLSSPEFNNYDSLLDAKFTDIEGLEAINDTLTTITNNIYAQGGIFNVINPTRLVVNVDRNLQNNFYLNGEVSVNLSSLLAGDKNMYVSDMHVFSLTPRWEKQSIGFYMPVLYNVRNQLWVGGAMKLGPLLFGVHNWGNVFSKKKMQNGGMYLSLVIRPGRKMDTDSGKGIDCPKL
jgi:hypothetical protein